VSAALQTVPGVKDVAVSYPKHEAVVIADKGGCSADAQKQLSAALTKAGYGGEVSKVEPGDE